MRSPIRNDHGHHSDLAQQELASTEHTHQTTDARGFVRLKVQHTKMQQARVQHNRMLAAAFYRGKRFAENNRKPPSPSAAKLVRQLGARPRPGESAKKRGKEGATQGRPEFAHGPEQKHELERNREHEQQQRHDQHHEQEQEQGRQHEQNQSGGGGPPQGNSQRDGQQKREDGDASEKRGKPRAFAVGKAARAKAAARNQLLQPIMQELVRRKLGAPDLPSELAAACTREVLRLTSQIEYGALLAVPLLLSMTSPMVMKQNPARLKAYRGALLAQQAATPEKAATTARVIELLADNGNARREADIQYSDDDNSIAMVKQRILDEARTQPPAVTLASARASDTEQEVRTAPAALGAKT